MPNLKKVVGERNLYQNSTSKTYFVRIQYKQPSGKWKDTFKLLGTKLKPDALKKMDAMRAGNSAGGIGHRRQASGRGQAGDGRSVTERYVKDG